MKGGLVNLAPALLGEGLIRSEAEYLALLDEMEGEWNDKGAKIHTCLLKARKPLDYEAGTSKS